MSLGENNEFRLPHVAVKGFADLQEEMPNKWLSVWVQGPKERKACSPGRQRYKLYSHVPRTVLQPTHEC